MFFSTIQTLAYQYWHLIFGVLSGAVIVLIGNAFSPLLALAAVVGIIVTVVFFKYPSLGLLCTVVLVPIERFGRFTDDSSELTISLMRIMGILVLAIVLIYKLVKKEIFTFSTPFFLYFGYTIMALLSITYSTDISGTTRAASSILANLLFFFMIVNLMTNKKLVLLSIVVWLVATLVIGVYSVYDWHLSSGQAGNDVSTNIDRGRGVQTTESRWSTVWIDKAEIETLGANSIRRSMGSTSHAAVYGINLVLTIPFFLFFLKLPINNFMKSLIWISLAIVAYNILLTNTRATIILTAIVILLCLYKGLYKLTMPIIILGMFSLVAMIFIVPEDVFNRILDLSNYTAEKSASFRIRQEYFIAGVKAFSDNWLLGLGVANENIIPQYLESWSVAPDKTTVHNEYLQSLMELGVIGAGFLFSFILLLLVYSMRAANNFKKSIETQQEYYFMIAVQVSMISTMIFSVQVDAFHFPLKGWWLIAGITVVMYQFSKNVSDDETNDNDSK